MSKLFHVPIQILYLHMTSKKWTFEVYEWNDTVFAHKVSVDTYVKRSTTTSLKFSFFFVRDISERNTVKSDIIVPFGKYLSESHLF